MSQQTIKQQARRTAREVAERRRLARVEKERRMTDLAVAAAEQLWTALPRGGYPNQAQERPMERLAAHAASIDNSLASGWPGRGAPDPRLAHMAETLQTAARLVRRYGSEISGHGTAVRRDLDAARARTMHAIYVSSHGVSVALHAHGHDRFREARQAGRKVSLSTVHSPYAIAPTGTWVVRFATAEAIARRYMAGGFATSVAGEARPPAGDHNRIPRALAGWDIQAHRTLAARSSAADNVTVSRTQALIAGVGLLLVDADSHKRAAATPATVGSPTDRLSASLDTLGRAWNNLASRWDDLPAPTDRPEPNLLRASAELRAAYRELTHDATTTFPPKIIAQHPGLERALNATLAAIETGPQLADVLAEKANQPGLAGRARALSRRAHNDIEAGLATPDPSGDVVWVLPGDILSKRMVQLPAPVTQALRTSSRTVQQATSKAASTAAHRPWAVIGKQPTMGTTSCHAPGSATQAQGGAANVRDGRTAEGKERALRNFSLADRPGTTRLPR